MSDEELMDLIQRSTGDYFGDEYGDGSDDLMQGLLNLF